MMEKRILHFALASCLGLALTVLVLWLGMANTAWAVDVRYVAPPGAGGSDSGNNCLASGSPCATVQHAIDEASAGDEVYIAGGTYAPGSTVAKIDKELTLIGAFSPENFDGPDPDMYETILDAGGNGSVVTVTNTSGVVLLHLTLVGGDGTGNCGTVGCGGGIHLENAELHVLHSVITGNVGSDSGRGWGGGIYVDNGSGGLPVTIFGSRIENNMGSTFSATSGSGGGVYAFSGEITLAENQIVNNAACNSTSSMCFGAGVYLSEVAHANVVTNEIRSNEANRGGTTTSWGGGLYISGGSGILLADNHIEGNRANWGGGGGIDIAWSQVHVTRNRFIGNRSGTGGGIYVRSLAPVTVTNNVIADNTVGVHGGGVILVHSSPPAGQALLVNNTIVSNTKDGVTTWGYAILTMTNNLLSGNPVGIRAYHPASATIAADHNLFWNTSDPISGTNAVTENPLLWDSFQLQEGSPALNAGTTISWLAVDLEGNPRPQDGVYDIGAFEGASWKVFLPLVLRAF